MIANVDIDEGVEILSESPVVCVPVTSLWEAGGATPPTSEFSLTPMEQQMLAYTKSLGIAFNGTSVILAARLLIKYLTDCGGDLERDIAEQCTEPPFATNDREHMEGLSASSQILKRLVENTIFTDERLRSFVRREKWPVTDKQYKDILMKVSLNSFSVSCSENRPPNGVALYFRAAIFNHDCNPSALQEFDLETGRITIRTARKIKAGEELMISYINHFNKPHWLRRTELLQSFHFLCCCEACVAEVRLCRSGRHARNYLICPVCYKRGDRHPVRWINEYEGPPTADAVDDNIICDDTELQVMQTILYVKMLKYPHLVVTAGVNAAMRKRLTHADDINDLSVSLSGVIAVNKRLFGYALPDPDLLTAVDEHNSLYICTHCYAEIPGSLYLETVVRVLHPIQGLCGRQNRQNITTLELEQLSKAINQLQEVLHSTSPTMTMITEKFRSFR
jgi:hypothetical protein